MNDSLYKKIIRKNGTKEQCLVAIEELSELQKAITKLLRLDHGDAYVPLEAKQNMMEEIADVQIMIKQLQIMFYISDEDITAWIQVKEDRLEERYL